MNIDGKEKQENPRYTLIVNFPGLSAGGIERGLAAIMRFFMQEGHRVIWLTTDQHLKKVAFNGIVDNPNLEIIRISKLQRSFGTPRIHFDREERVIMLSVHPTRYLIAEAIRRKASVREFRHYMLIAHYTGNNNYPDKVFKAPWLQKLVYRFYRRILKRILDNKALIAYSVRHLECYEEYYKIPIDNKKEQKLPNFSQDTNEFDLANVLRRCEERNDKFIITTCARFEFPHKGYILGLVDTFGSLKAKYPQVQLCIIGYGEGESELKARIAQLPEEMQKDITLVGMVSPDDLKTYYKNSHLIVGLAGAIGEGARSGIPSLITRHYCEKCETYGFFENAYTKSLSADEGEDILPYIEDAITMKPEEYIAHAQVAFESRMSRLNVNKEYFYQHKGADKQTVKWPLEALLCRLLYIMTGLIRRWEKE